MKTLLLLLLLPGIALCQTPYYDAVFLSNHGTVIGTKVQITINDNNRAQIVEIFRKYVKQDFTDLATEINVVSANPFISISGTTQTGVAGGTFKSLAGSALQSIGGLDVTTLTQGLAAFLVDRAKEELNVAFFARLKDLFDAYPEFNTLFPHTKVFIDNFESWNYANLLNTLREAFDKDLKDILGQMIALRNLDASSCPADLGKNSLNNCKERLKDLHDFFQTNEGRILLSALQVGNGFTQGQKVPDVLNTLVSADFLLGFSFATPAEQNDFNNSLTLLNFLSQSLKSNDISRHYLSTAEFNALITPVGNNVQKIYLGLLYQQILNANIVIGGKNVSTIMATQVAGILNYLIQLERLSKNVQTSYDVLLEGMAEARKDLTPEYSALLTSSQQLLQGLGNIALIDPTFVSPPVFQKVLVLSSSALQIVLDVKAKNYNGALIEVIKLLSDKISEARQSPGKASSFQNTDQFIASLLKYGSFASNVVSSKDPDEVKEAIRAVALPAGSSSIKKHSSFNVSVNAYVGFVWGQERPMKDTYTVTNADGTKKTVQLNGGKPVSIYAPIGIGLNKGIGWNTWKNPMSVSAFISLIDIGAMVGYRFTNDSTFTGAPSIKLANIISPGINIAVGLPYVPVSVGFGIQRISTFQRDPSTNELYNVDFAAWRWPQLFIALDIPLANLYNGKKTLLHNRTRR